MKKAVIICGPTASGKTDFAHQFALKHDGEVVNADSMQIYKEIPIITASPEKNLKSEVKYHLYNFQAVDQDFSAIKYAEKAAEIVLQIAESGKLPVITGGSGLYIDMLVKGYNLIPDIEPEIRQEARDLLNEVGGIEFHRRLSILDPEIVKVLNKADTQRLLRSYEVALQTGESILHFQNREKYKPLEGFEFEIYLLMPEREFLYETCNKRFRHLFEHGALEEVRALSEKYPGLNTTASKALGVAEISDYLKGKIDKEAAVEFASMHTRRYAKRQCTWFNNQITEKIVIKFASEEQYLEKTLEIIRSR